MASAQLAGSITIKAVRRDGNSRDVSKGHISVFASAGGAPDGALATVGAIDTRHVIPESGPMLRPDDKILIEFTSEIADGMDVSDSVWVIPVTEYDTNGRRIGVKHLSQGQFTTPTPADFTAVVGLPIIVGGYTVTEAGLRIGGSHVFLDAQNDTA